MYYNLTLRGVLVTIVVVEITESVKCYKVCAVPNLFGKQSACAVSYSHLWPVWLYHVVHLIS
jgi:hypothetical protein